MLTMLLQYEEKSYTHQFGTNYGGEKLAPKCRMGVGMEGRYPGRTILTQRRRSCIPYLTGGGPGGTVQGVYVGDLPIFPAIFWCQIVKYNFFPQT